MEQTGFKVVLSTGKSVILKEMKIKYNRLALQAVGNRAGDNKALLGIMMQEELLKILLYQVDEKLPDKTAMEDLDNLFSNKEFMEIMTVIVKIAGTDDQLGNLATEIVSIGKP